MITAVIDSCVIFGMPLCDTLLRAAEQKLYRIVLSQKILEDATRNMVIKGRLKPDKNAIKTIVKYLGRERIELIQITNMIINLIVKMI
jgi:hypothetical protein